MRAAQLSDTLSVSGQISVADVAEIAAGGFKVLINNRPDHEEVSQPTSADIFAAAEQAGLEYYHMPVTARDFPGADIEQMGLLFDNATKPAFAFCRTGTRCANLWVQTRDAAAREGAIAGARQFGFDLSMATANT
jgi:uncharacterized protein (TIGR01244 family)